jgi:DDE superfamily endonuclease
MSDSSDSSDDDLSDDDSTSDDDLCFDRPNSRRQRAHKAAVVAAVILLLQKKRRQSNVRMKRKKSANKTREHVDPMRILALGVSDGNFKQEYRMSKESLFKLHSLLQPDLVESPKNQRGDVIDSLTKVMIGLRYLAGSRWVDIVRIHGVGRSTVFKVTQDFVRACVKHPLLGKPKFPTNETEAEEYAREWANLSRPFGSERHGVLDKCIGAIDGILIKTRAPSKKETSRVTDFYSGHKKAIGLNAQVLCDAKKRVIFLSVLCPGKTNDLVAYESSKRSSLVEGLPDGYYAVGNNAYVNSNHLLVPFAGHLSISDPRDAFNFFLSQLRVRVENCFALLVGRWGILWGPLKIPLRHQPVLIKAICCLHNFCIDEGDIKPSGNPTRSSFSPQIVARDENGVLVDSTWSTRFQFQRNTTCTSLRDDLVSFIESEGLERPK